MRAYIVRVRGGEESDTAYLIDRFMAIKNIKGIHVSAFEREKWQYRDELFRRGLVGYILVLAKEEIDPTMWYRLRLYLSDHGYYAGWPAGFDPKELSFGPFLRAVLEKIRDFIFASHRSEKERRVTLWHDLHELLGLAREHAHAVFARWTAWIRPVSGIDTG